MKEIESEWVRLVRVRFEPEDWSKLSYEEENSLLCLLNAPEQYEVENEMLSYAIEHPNANMRELVEVFEKKAPAGLPTNAPSWLYDMVEQ